MVQLNISQVDKSKVPEKAVHAAIWYLGLMMACLCAVLLSYVISLVPANWRGVPWLDNKPTDKHIDDKDDKWKSFRDLALHKRGLRPDQPLRRVKTVKAMMSRTSVAWNSLLHNLDRKKTSEEDMKGYKELTRFGFAIECCKRVVYLLSYAFGMFMNLYAFTIVKPFHTQTMPEYSQTDEEQFSMWTCYISNGCNFVISTYLAALLLLQCCQFPHQSPPFLSKIYVPFTLRLFSIVVTVITSTLLPSAVAWVFSSMQ